MVHGPQLVTLDIKLGERYDKETLDLLRYQLLRVAFLTGDHEHATRFFNEIRHKGVQAASILFIAPHNPEIATQNLRRLVQIILV